MNYGGGPPFGNLPPFTNAPPFGGVPPPGMPMFPPVFPGMMPPMTNVPGAVPGQPLPTVYPPGQGPLAGRAAQRGANGLFEAPEPEGPEIHEAQQFMKLNPGEVVKYGEYWAQAVGDGETVGGKEAVAFLGRAAKVSKGQLRRIWDIADHRKEGELGRDEFFIALRLLSLAQRGAELSVAGLRNFTGIQLIPDIAPEVKEAPAEPTEAAPEVNVFSWTVPADVVARYDSFFKSLDVRKVGMIDGKQGVTFFGKSGLPRPTLKKIWELADVTRDGMLSLEEFRMAMHMVANIRNKRLTVTALPSALDPSGPNWLRIEGQEPPPGPSIVQSDAQGLGSNEGMPMAQAGGQDPVILAPPGQPMPLSPQQPIQLQEAQHSQVLPSAQSESALQPHEQMQPPMPADNGHPETRQDVHSPRDEAEQMREALRKERMEVERARREMEEMKAEMERLRLEKVSRELEEMKAEKERLRLEKASLATAQAAAQAPINSAGLPYGQNQPSAPLRSTGSIPAAAAQASRMQPPSSSPQVAPQSGPIVLGPPATPPTAPTHAPAVPARTEPISLGNDDDDDIWDQPSPKASALPGPSVNNSKTTPAMQSNDSVSSDDDDDFWGGLGAKPTLGPAGGQGVGASSNGNGGKGFGGSELDDWVF